MGVFVITNGEGTYIRKDETTGKYVPIRSFSKATQWDSIVKANGILNNSIAKNIRSGYAVQLVDTEKTVVKENTSVQNDLCFRNITDDNIIDRYHELINHFKDLSEEIIKITGIDNELLKEKK